MPSKFQQPYDRKKIETQRALISDLNDEIGALNDKMRGVTDPDLKKAIKSEIDAKKIRINSIKKGQPVKPRAAAFAFEESQNLKEGLDDIKDKWVEKITKRGRSKSEVSDFANEQVRKLEDRYGDDYGAIVGTLKKILSNKYDVSLDEEAQAAITTSTVGSPTMSTSDGGTEPAVYGSSHIHAKHMGTFSRRGGYKPPKPFSRTGGYKKKKKKNKTRKEFVEYYFESEE